MRYVALWHNGNDWTLLYAGKSDETEQQVTTQAHTLLANESPEQIAQRLMVVSRQTAEAYGSFRYIQAQRAKQGG